MEYDLDLSLDAREFVGELGLQPANKGAKNVKPASRAKELMAPARVGAGAYITSVRRQDDAVHRTRCSDG